MSLRIVPAGQEWQTPTFVIIWWRDGTVEERAFPTRVKAEAFIHAIPIMSVWEPESEFADIIKAKLRKANLSIN